MRLDFQKWVVLEEKRLRKADKFAEELIVPSQSIDAGPYVILAWFNMAFPNLSCFFWPWLNVARPSELGGLKTPCLAYVTLGNPITANLASQ